jgi:large subunit ribosomal protein L9
MGKVNVLLLEDIQGLGRAGDIVSVNEGYARNSLFPAGQAAQATPTVQRKYADKRAKETQSKAQALVQLQKKAEILDGTELTLAARVKEGDTIYGSITAKDILSELINKANLNIKASQLDINVPIKQLGSYDLTIHLSPQVECVMKLTVVADPSSLKKENDDE